jgi:hypothetical protein
MIKNIGVICKKKQGDYEDIKKTNGGFDSLLGLCLFIGFDDLAIEYVQGILEQGVLLSADRVL